MIPTELASRIKKDGVVLSKYLCVTPEAVPLTVELNPNTEQTTLPPTPALVEAGMLVVLLPKLVVAVTPAVFTFP
jgi:hypothetical protein